MDLILQILSLLIDIFLYWPLFLGVGFLVLGGLLLTSGNLDPTMRVILGMPAGAIGLVVAIYGQIVWNRFRFVPEERRRD